MSLLGTSVSKGTYNVILWVIIGALFLFLGLFIYRFRNSNILTQEAKQIPSEPVKVIETDIQKQVKALDEAHKAKVESIRRFAGKAPQAQELAAKKIKGAAFENSAAKRKLIQGDSFSTVEGGLTPLELRNKIKKEGTNYKGKSVLTPLGEGKATGQSSFGRVGVEFPDGTVKFIDSADVKPKKTVKELIAESKKAEPIKPVEPEAIKPSIVKPKPVELPKVEAKPKAIAPELPKVKAPEPKLKEIPVIKEVPKVKEVPRIKATEDLSAPKTGTHKSKFIERLEKVFEGEPNADELVKELKKIDRLPSTTDAARIELASKVIERDFESAMEMVKRGNRFSNDIEGEIGFQLVDKLQQAGRVNEAFDIIEAVARKGSKVGGQLQLMKRWSKFTPQGMQKWANNTFKNAGIEIDKEVIAQLGVDIRNINSATTEDLAEMVAKKVGKKVKKVDSMASSIVTDLQLEKIATGKVNKKTAIEMLEKKIKELDIRVAKESLEKLVNDLKSLETLDEKQ